MAKMAENELEPGLDADWSLSLQAEVSAAVSLRRIADTLAAMAGMMTAAPCNNYGETFLPALARAISDGMAGRV